MTSLYEADNHILIHAGYQDPVEHSHMAAQITVSLGEAIRITSGGTVFSCLGAMIPTGVSHKVNTQDIPVLVFLFDCTTNVARKMQKLRCIPEEICREIARRYTVFQTQESTEHYWNLLNCLYDYLEIPQAASCVTDERVLSAIRYVRDNLSERITTGQVAKMVCLSESRFSHLFKAQMGMTFAAFLIYQRIMRVYSRILNGVSITEAALEAGFSSSAHFADVNRRVFGISASNIMQDIRFVKIE